LLTAAVQTLKKIGRVLSFCPLPAIGTFFSKSLPKTRDPYRYKFPSGLKQQYPWMEIQRYVISLNPALFSRDRLISTLLLLTDYNVSSRDSTFSFRYFYISHASK
jgi:hypothetical protein